MVLSPTPVLPPLIETLLLHVLFVISLPKESAVPVGPACLHANESYST